MNNEITVIDVKDLVWRLLSGWKLLLLAVLALGIILSALFYVRDLSKYNKELALEKIKNEVVTDEKKEELLSSLTDADRKKVEALLSGAKTIDRLQYYLDNSLLMQLDPFNMDFIELDYEVSSGGKDISGSVGAIIDTYSRYVRRDSFVNAVRISFDTKADRNSVNEMIQFNNSEIYDGVDKATFYVKVIIPKEADEIQVKDTVTAELKKAHDYVNKKVEAHSLKQNSFSISKNTDMTLSQNRMNIENTILNMSNTSANILTALSSDGAEIYTILLNSQRANKADAPAREEEIEKPGFSVKKCIVSFVLAFILYCVAFAAYLILRGRVSSADSATDDLGSKCIGEAYYEGKHSGLSGLLYSGSIVKKRFGKFFGRKEQSDTISQSIKNRLKFEGLNDIDFLVVGEKPDGNVSDCIERIHKTLKKEKIDATVSEFALSGHVAPDESQFVDKTNAVPVIIGNETTNKEIATLKGILKDYDVNLPGLVYIEEV